MNLKNIQNTFSQVLKQRNFAYVVSGVLLVTNMVLAYKVISHDETWILIPWPETHKRLSVSRTTFSDPYLIEWADTLTSRLLTMNPKTADQRVYEFLLVTESSAGLETKLKAQAQKLKQENLSTAFYPREYQHKKDTRQLWVTGDFHTFFGSDKSPVIQQRTVVLTYRKGPLGVILVQDFNYEDKHAQN
jgi:type IV conjugative transfer system protein TraE